MRLLHAEWTKLRTVRGWVVALVVALLATLGLGLLAAAVSHASCGMGTVEVPCEPPTTGPDGQVVNDRFFFVHQRLDGDGAITARVNSMTGRIKKPPPPGTEGPGPEPVPGVVPWAKAGIMIKDGVRQGTGYAALMLTGEHGVRLQHNYYNDQAGNPGGGPRWLRLTRSGDTITGHESTDGRVWGLVGTVTMPGLAKGVDIGLFAASPGDLTVPNTPIGGFSTEVRFAEVTADIDQVSLPGPWQSTDLGVQMEPGTAIPHHPGGLEQSGDTYTVTGVGDIGPSTEGQAVERILVGAFLGLIVVIVVAVMFITAEYRRGLIRTTLTAGPGRGRVLAAKAAVVGAVAFTAGLVASAVAIPVGTRMLRGNGIFVLPVSTATELRVVLGTAALFALTAVLALGLGVLLRRSVPAVTAAIVLVVVPYVLATASVVPTGVGEWLLRLTPAAGFAVQQSIPVYEQVVGHYVPAAGYLPLPPWAGLAVLCAYAGLALVLATHRLRRSDA
jgi:hypothetical protein